MLYIIPKKNKEWLIIRYRVRNFPRILEDTYRLSSIMLYPLGLCLLLAVQFVYVSSFHTRPRPLRSQRLSVRSVTRLRSDEISKRMTSKLPAVGGKQNDNPIERISDKKEEETAFEKVASMGLAGVLAIAVAESIFWALGVPLAELYYKFTTGEWIDIMTTDGQLKAAGFSFGYGGFATVILQYRVTLFAIPLVPLMQKYVVEPGKKMFGEQWGEKSNEDDVTNKSKLYAMSPSYTIIGATSGVGQTIVQEIMKKEGENAKIKAVTRNRKSAEKFKMLEGCNFVQADARDPLSLPPALENTDFLILSIGTTAFPSKKWEEGKNKPKIACLDSVVNILDAVKCMDIMKRPKKVILISSIGVERANQLPFSILNSFGVLDYKRESERVLREFSEETGITSIVVRPGRLVGAPFTNNDLAALFKTDQGKKRGLEVSRRDDVAGDTERRDVATVVLKVLEMKSSSGTYSVFSVVNKKGDALTESALRELLSPVV